VVELRNVCMQFEEKKVLDDLSLKVEPEERLVIMGQSGSGKSTLLRLILGTLPPNSGAIFFKQFEITRLKRRKLQRVRQHIGMVYQYSAAQFRDVRDNVRCRWKNSQTSRAQRSIVKNWAGQHADSGPAGPHWRRHAPTRVARRALV
jgi:ABC-type transporter Mla maintaining outer membrane lipid asymmetry ATPase subunit MlaF